jgi:hypothetical protein
MIFGKQATWYPYGNKILFFLFQNLVDPSEASHYQLISYTSYVCKTMVFMSNTRLNCFLIEITLSHYTAMDFDVVITFLIILFILKRLCNNVFTINKHVSFSVSICNKRTTQYGNAIFLREAYCAIHCLVKDKQLHLCLNENI